MNGLPVLSFTSMSASSLACPKRTMANGSRCLATKRLSDSEACHKTEPSISHTQYAVSSSLIQNVLASKLTFSILFPCRCPWFDLVVPVKLDPEPSNVVWLRIVQSGMPSLSTWCGPWQEPLQFGGRLPFHSNFPCKLKQVVSAPTVLGIVLCKVLC